MPIGRFDRGPFSRAFGWRCEFVLCEWVVCAGTCVVCVRGVRVACVVWCLWGICLFGSVFVWCMCGCAGVCVSSCCGKIQEHL